MKVKPATWFGLAIILAGVCFGAKSLVTNLTPYVTFADARKAGAKTQVQVMGSLDKQSVANSAGQLEFTIVADNGDRMPVFYRSTVPANFSQAIQVTAIGNYDGAAFQANQLLVKCPSKYQGTEERSYSAGGGMQRAGL